MQQNKTWRKKNRWALGAVPVGPIPLHQYCSDAALITTGLDAFM